MAANDFSITYDNSGTALRIQGPLDLYHVPQARALLTERQARIIDLSGLTRLDTAGALFLRELQEAHRIELHGLSPEHHALFMLAAKANLTLPPPMPEPHAFRQLLCRTGEKTINIYDSTLELLDFFGQACLGLWRAIRSPRQVRFASILHHIEETGINAIPIIALIAFLIAVVLAYQGVAQLRPLGGQHYTVNLVAISVLREMGVLLTAIMVAGRSGSAFTAEIGVMKVREEVDALQVIGIRPFDVLVMPRLIALLIALPLLTFIANIMGLIGGALMCTVLIDVPLEQYIERVHNVVRGRDYLVGMIKAPVFALLIGIVGCLHGMKVSGSAESVGRETTTSVVKSIFLVLIADAIFSIFFQKVGL